MKKNQKQTLKRVLALVLVIVTLLSLVVTAVVPAIAADTTIANEAIQYAIVPECHNLCCMTFFGIPAESILYFITAASGIGLIALCKPSKKKDTDSLHLSAF